ncbi:chromosome segregation protein [Chlamydia trachomatis]|nr:chromosome segregation protein [Chlamydia trachomatis]
MTVKINELELENVKRIKAVKIEPTENGLTIVGGNNNQGKTSVLDAIAWALGGNKFKPSQPNREGSVLPPNLKITLNNGLIVTRTGKNSSLKVTDPEGSKSGQQILNKLIGEMALNVPKFMASTPKEKANYLLNILGIGEELTKLEMQERKIYDDRRAIGQIALQKQKYADELQDYPDTPKELVSASELIKQQQTIMAHNAENQRKRMNQKSIYQEYKAAEGNVIALEAQLTEAKRKLDKLTDDLETANKDIVDLVDESTDELEENIKEIDAINVKVRANVDKERATKEAEEAQQEYEDKSLELKKVREEKMHLLDSVQLPLPGLSIEEGEIVFNGQKWDNMSGSDQLKVSTAIVRKLNPNCGFVLLDKLEQMDLDTLKEFGEWLESEGLQAIATRVSTGDECSIIIDDGYAIETEKEESKPKQQFTGFTGFGG